MIPLKQGALWRSHMRKVTYTLPRFISILLMIALGSFVFVGLLTTPASLEKTLYSYLDRYHMPDLTVSHPLGLDVDDQMLLKESPGLEDIVFAYQADQVVKETGDVLRLESPNPFPTYDLRAGRLPQNNQEIALSQALQGRYQIGQMIQLDNGGKDIPPKLSQDHFRVCGFVASPMDINPSISGTNSAFGSGNVTGFGVIKGELFLDDNPSIAYLQFSDVKGLYGGDQRYLDRMNTHLRQVQDRFATRPKDRYALLLRQTNAGLADGQKALNQANDQVEEGIYTLNTAKAQLDRAQLSLQQGREQVTTQSSLAQKQLLDSGQSLAQAHQSLMDGQNKLSKGEQALNTGQFRLNQERQRLSKAQQDYQASRERYLHAKAQATSGQTQLVTGRQSLDRARQDLAAREADYRYYLAQQESHVQKLQNAKITLSEGQKNMALLQSQLDALNQQIQGEKQTLRNQQLEVSRLQAAFYQANQAYQQALAQGNTAQLPQLAQDLEQARLAYNQRNANYLAASQAYQSKQAAYQNQSMKLSTMKQKISEAQSFLGNNESILANAQAKLQESQVKLDVARQEIEKQQQVYEQMQITARHGTSQLASAEKQLQEANLLLSQGEGKLSQAQEDLDNKARQFALAKQTLTASKQAWEQGMLSLQKGQKELSQQNSQAGRQLDQSLKELLARQEDYYRQHKSYFENYPDIIKELNEQQNTLNDSKQAFQRLVVPEYDIRDRASYQAVSDFAQSAEGMRLMSRIFPVFFYLIALLICLTTMTRMVEDDRGQIGTLKGLGYTSSAIMRGYIFYGAAASLIGTFIGSVLGYQILMPLIVDAYYTSAVFPEVVKIIHPWIPFVSLAVGLLCTAFAAFLSSHQLLQEQVANLLRPRAPKNGTRILLESIQPFWRRLSFDQKITFRNVFRYKKRAAMTILGVAGCMGLITMGLGLNYAITGVFDRQFQQLHHYDMIAIYDDRAPSNKLQDLNSQLNQSPQVAAHTSARYEQGSFPLKGQSDQSLSIITPLQTQDFGHYLELVDAKTGQNLSLENGPVLTAKTARILGLKAGDSIRYQNMYGDWHTITIQGVCENYIGHSLFLSEKDYSNLFGKPLIANANYIQLKDPKQIENFSKDFLKHDISLAAIKTTSTSAMVDDLTQSLKVIVKVIIAVSMLLALVVLYNLTNINVEERLRELSTIKVLGFYPLEVTAYIYRESFLLTIIGLFLGIGLGKFLHTLICRALAPPAFTMMEIIPFQDYLWAAFFTLLTSLIVMAIMHRKMQKVDMVQALKGVD